MMADIFRIMKSLRRGLLVMMGSVMLGGSVGAVDVALTVREWAGIDRVDNPVNSGVPLPKGAVMDVSELRLLDAEGQVVPAGIQPRKRWLGDNSLQWVTVHFGVDQLAANAEMTYRLVRSDKPMPKSPLSITQEGRAIVVVTGPARFVIPTDRFGPFEQVYVLENGAKDRAFTDRDAMLAAPSRMALISRSGESRVVPRTDAYPDEFRSELVRIDSAALAQQAVVHSTEIEEQGPGRAVVALRGTFSTPEKETLDFVARLYFYAGSSLAQMTFSVVNRQMDSFAGFVGIEKLVVEVPMKADAESRLKVSADGETLDYDLSSDTRLVQTRRDRMEIRREGVADPPAQTRAQLDGWMSIAAPKSELVAGSRWFWQTYPMGFSVSRDGVAGLEIKADADERVDLYAGGAKTHFLFFRFGHQEADAPASIAAGTSHPLFAVCSPDWYCQETRVFGDLYSANPDLYLPEYRDVIARFQENIDDGVRTIVAQRPRPEWQVDEFGWLNFGSGLHHRTKVRENAAESWWDGNYYDFPLAALINFARTGNLINLRTAEEAGLHLADLDICHSYPGQPTWAGSPRSGPVVGHFRNYTRGQTYTGHGSFTFYKNESLYELYYLTGERWYLDIGRMSSEFAMARFGQGALRNLAHGIWGVLSAYRDTHEKKYLDRARFFVDEWGKPWQDKHNGSFDDQHWMYGLLFEAYDRYFRISGDAETAAYMVRALDAKIAEWWEAHAHRDGLPGISLFGFGLGYEYTQDEDYLEKGLVLLARVAAPEASRDRVKTFAQNFRSSPYFLKYLTKEYQANRPVPVVEK